MKKDFLCIQDMTSTDVESIFNLASELKTQQNQGQTKQLLAGKTLAMIFHKPSIRTRISFDVAMFQLGGHTIKMTEQDAEFGKRESIPDIARTLSRFVDAIMIRTFDQEQVEELAKHASIPVINGLTDSSHPCQALTDLFTIKEKAIDCAKMKFTYIGDGNNVARSLINLAALMNFNLHIASPRGYQPEAELLRVSPTVTIHKDLQKAVADADVVYTDTWASMGQEDEAAERAKVFAKFQLNRKLLDLAKPTAYVMHCLPAHRGLEITDEVIDSAQSIVFDQAENRLHVQKAILVKLMSKC
ncbi:MAG: ornithine carbamoyltransferase [Candidatus Magasanikbacteria bacterium]|nr:ornithine carbamoyltransferase [Candidatus Magasanikbacteria bacterium]